MMSHDNRLIPVSGVERGLDRPLSDLTQTKPYGTSATESSDIRDYLHVVMKRKWLILSLVVAITSLVTVQMFRQPSIYMGATTIKIEPKTTQRAANQGSGNQQRHRSRTSGTRN